MRAHSKLLISLGLETSKFDYVNVIVNSGPNEVLPVPLAPQ